MRLYLDTEFNGHGGELISLALVTIICDWPVDAMHFCASLAGQDFESSLDFPCEIKILRTPPGQSVSLIPHYALEDARALRHWHLNHCI